MIVFGGRDVNGLVDNEVYALKLSDLSWSRLDRVTGSPSPPAAREGNSILVEDARRYTRGSPSSSGWSRMFVFGGRKASVLTDELWVLWINPAGDKVEWEQLSPTRTIRQSGSDRTTTTGC